MTSFIVEAQSIIEELKMFLEVESLDEIKKLDKLYTITILHAMNPYFNHVRNQLLIGHKVPFMESLTTQLLRVPTLQTRNVQEPIESSIMVSTRRKGGSNTRGGFGSKGCP